MSSPEPALVVIECPHCGTRYQLDYEMVGPRGRRVSCAHCGNSWKARAEESDEPMQAVAAREQAVVDRSKALADLAEELLDEKFENEERKHRERREASAKAHADEMAARARARAEADATAAARAANRGGRSGPVPVEAEGDALPLDAADMEQEPQRTIEDIRAAIAPRAKPSKVEMEAARKRQREFSARQRSLADSLPIARLRRVARLAALAALVIVFGGGIAFRAAAVQQFPQLAEAYAAVGLGVNVVGLEFHNVRTLKSLQNGTEILQVDGEIASVATREVVLPQVIVTLLGKTDNSLYEWSVTPKATELEPGETLAFQTQLSAPPKGAVSVKLTFANGRAKLRPLDDIEDDNAAGGTSFAPSTAITFADKRPND